MISNAPSPAIFDDASRSPAKPSMLRSILPSRQHKRNQSAGDTLPTVMPGTSFLASGFLPADHPHAQPLGERAHNRDAAGPKPTKGGLHKKTKSSVSLKSLIKDREKKENPRPAGDSPNEEGSFEKKMRKMKSTASLSAILKRSSRDRKGEAVNEPKEREKENRRPVSEVVASPIWAQFATQSQEDSMGNVFVPESGRSLEEEVSLYTPKQYSPSKQRNFYDYHQPTLAQKPRPKSDYISSGTTKVREMLGQIQRVPSGKKRHPEMHAEIHNVSDERTSYDSKRNSGHSSGRVMAAVSAFNAKDVGARRDQDSKKIESEFEKLLVRTNQ